MENKKEEDDFLLKRKEYLEWIFRLNMLPRELRFVGKATNKIMLEQWKKLVGGPKKRCLLLIFKVADEPQVIDTEIKIILNEYCSKNIKSPYYPSYIIMDQNRLFKIQNDVDSTKGEPGSFCIGALGEGNKVISGYFQFTLLKPQNNDNHRNQVEFHGDKEWYENFIITQHNDKTIYDKENATFDVIMSLESLKGIEILEAEIWEIIG